MWENGGSCLPPSGWLLGFEQLDFNTPVLSPAIWSRIVRDGSGRTEPASPDTRGREVIRSICHQELFDRLGTSFGQSEIRLFITGVVSVAGNLDRISGHDDLIHEVTQRIRRRSTKCGLARVELDVPIPLCKHPFDLSIRSEV